MINMQSDTQITENFKYEELYGKRPDNRPETEEQFCNLLYGAYKILQPVRDQFGLIYVTSGRRNLQHNRSLGSKDTSDHVTGNAYDIVPKYENCDKVYKWIIDNLNYDKVIFERRGNTEWIHVSFKRLDRNRKLNYVSLSKNKYVPYNGQSLEKVL